MAPILSFTGEEVWTQLDGDDSVFLHTWYEIPAQADEAILLDRWTRIRAVRADVQKELETLRAAGDIGSSLQAEVTLHASPETASLLEPLGDDLRFVLITSQAHVVSAETDRIEVTPSAAKKCERCWHYREDVDTHAGLCGRCVSNLAGNGEARTHA